MSPRGSLRWILLALLGLAVAAGVALAASQLASRQIGIASESVSAGDSLAPPITSPAGAGGEGGGEKPSGTETDDSGEPAPGEEAGEPETPEAPSEAVEPETPSETVEPEAPAETVEPETSAPSKTPSHSEGGDEHGGGGGGHGGPDD